jgi:hypothetical protein
MSSRVVSGGVVHTVPMDLSWLGCTHRKDKELSPSVRWVLRRRSKASA